jgi:hypothetical protein
MRPVFIVGFSRTGSTLLQHVLNSHPDVGILPEMHIYWPKRLHTDFVSTVKKHIGDLSDDDKVEQLIKLMYSKQLIGTFWQVIDRFDIDKVELKKRINNSDRTIKSIVDSLLRTLAESYNKKIIGVKFPVHFSYINKLFEWYSDCKIIHTVRDPRAIFASQYYKHKDKKNLFIKNIFIGIVQFIHVTLSLKGIGKLHKNLSQYDGYRLYHYEQGVDQPEKSLKALCDFLEIEFSERMLNPKKFYNSSFGEKLPTINIYKSSKEAWQDKLPSTICWLIKILNRRTMKGFGYF